ncbi:hypothetical protein ACIGXE_36940, partial [Streptomyces sp. NPDC053431]
QPRLPQSRRIRGRPRGLTTTPMVSAKAEQAQLSRLQAGEQFAYVFDMGDDWAHLCTVGERRIDPFDEFGETPDRPVPYWGWGSLPDQYARRWDGDDGESPMPKRPAGGLSDLPPILPWWGGHRRG